MNLNDIKDLVKFIKSNKIKEFSYKKGDEELSFKLGGGADESLEQAIGAKVRRSIENEQLNRQVSDSELVELNRNATNDVHSVKYSKDKYSKEQRQVQTDEISEIAQKQAATALETQSNNYVKVVSPFVGSFYRSSGPDSPAFVEVGSTIEKGSPICIVEAMKIMNEIEVDMKCRIISVLAENGQLVEYYQPLFLVEPL